MPVNWIDSTARDRAETALNVAAMVLVYPVLRALTTQSR
jgi:hypothetical protein